MVNKKTSQKSKDMNPNKKEEKTKKRLTTRSPLKRGRGMVKLVPVSYKISPVLLIVNFSKNLVGNRGINLRMFPM